MTGLKMFVKKREWRRKILPRPFPSDLLISYFSHSVAVPFNHNGFGMVQQTIQQS